MKCLLDGEAYANAYATGVFAKEQGICSCCKQQRAYRYTNSFYSKERPEYICPWCIQDESAAQLFNGEFNDYCGIEGISPDPDYPSRVEISKDFLNEVCCQTPSYNSWQQEVWLVHCDEPCQFVGYADYDTVVPLLPELSPDIAYIEERHLRKLSKTGHFVGYLFQCVKCGLHRLHTDSD